MLYRVVQSISLHWLTLCEGKCISFFLHYWLFVCTIVYVLLVPNSWLVILVNFGYIYCVSSWGFETTWWDTWLIVKAHEDMLSHKGGVCDTHENTGISCCIRYMCYIVQCDHGYGIPLGSVCVGYATWLLEIHFYFNWVMLTYFE